MEARKYTVLCPGCGALCEEKAAWCRACGGEIGKDAIRILPAGTLLDQERYTLTGYVGRGGSAITYKARQRNFTSEIVLREYFPSMIAKRGQDGQMVVPTELPLEMTFERGKLQFRREGDSLRSLRDISNIVTVYDVFEDNNTVYMVEDYIKGESLQAYLAREGKLSFRQAMQIMTPVMKALSAVHSREIIHRDVKPSNIMLEKGVPCLIDFGISRKIVEATTLSADQAQRTRSIAPSYTRGYAALEQITGEERETTAVDVYGAAATLYRMVTGVSPDDALTRLKKDLLLSPIDAGALITKGQSDLIMKGLALHAMDRFQNMQIFLNLLEESLQEPGNAEFSGTEEAGTPKRAIPWIPLINTILVICILYLFVTRFLPSFIGKETAQVSGSTEGGTQGEQAASQEEIPAEEEAPEEEAAPIAFSARFLDCRSEALSYYRVRLSRLYKDDAGNTLRKAIWEGKTDPDGWTAELEAESTDESIEFELLDTGHSQTMTLLEIQSLGSQFAVSFPFHLYPETYSHSGHTYALGDLSDAPGLTSYDRVEAYCESIGGHLAVIGSAAEDEFLYDMSCRKGETTAFFGYSDQDSEGRWEWAWGDSSYTNWTRAGKTHPAPDNGGPGYGPENYAEYNEGDDAANDGSWNDAKFAVNTSTFIIEWEF